MKHKRAFLGLFAFFVLSSPAIADISSKEYAKCTTIEGDLARLNCFDNLAKEKKLNGPQAQATTVKGKGMWSVRVDKNPVDDSKKVTLVLDAKSGKSNWGKSVFLVIRCKSNKTEMYINWQDYLGSEAHVLTRIGSKKAKTKEWGLSTDSKATFHPRGTIGFIKEMMTANKLLAQVTPYNDNPITAIFDTKGLINAIKPLRETCHW
jgi:type VI secretion system protein VasI